MFERRLKIFLAVLSVLGVGMAARLYQLQILKGEDYVQQAEEALLSPKQFLPPLRGRIMDRFGRVLVSDEPAYDVTVHYGVLCMSRPYLLMMADRIRQLEGQWHDTADEAVEEEIRHRIAQMWLKLTELSGAPMKELRGRRDSVCRSVEHLRRHIWQARARGGSTGILDKLVLREEELFHSILRDVTPEQRTRVELELGDLPCVRVEPSVRRVWAEGVEPVCHLLGRLGQVSVEMIEADPLADDVLASYRAGDEAGISGVEKLGEHMLRGKRGFEEKYRDGRVKAHAPPIDGPDVQLTVDLDLQTCIAAILSGVMADVPNCTGASCVVLDVQTREILALVSVPTYDRQSLQGGFEQLRDDTRNLPLLFRAVQGEYQPGSILKPVAMLAGFAAGMVDPQQAVFCDGQLMPGTDKWHCWTHWRGLAGHGYLAAEEALQHSCNVYFYTLGQRLGAQRLTDFYAAFVQGCGLQADSPRGTGLIEERPGLVPDLAWLKANRRRGFRVADGRNFAIGQGEILVTPLHAANIFATIAAGRYRHPTIIANDMRDRPALEFPRVPEHGWKLVRRGLYRCVNEDGGTAYAHARMDELAICGKTGSAECAPRVIEQAFSFAVGRSEDRVVTVVAPTVEAAREKLGLPCTAQPVGSEAVRTHPPADPETGSLPTHAWFAGYAPYDDPRIALSVLVEYGGSGGKVAGPIARQVFEAIIESPHGYLAR